MRIYHTSLSYVTPYLQSVSSEYARDVLGAKAFADAVLRFNREIFFYLISLGVETHQQFIGQYVFFLVSNVIN